MELPKPPAELQEEETAYDFRTDAIGMLNSLPNAPGAAQIEQWKREHGEKAIYMTVFGEKDIYIYTHLTRNAWKAAQQYLSNTGGNQEALQEQVLSSCLLWPQFDNRFKYNSRAGIIPSLFESIMVNSAFLNVQQVMELTVNL